MKLWHIEIIDENNWTWDCYSGFVICAESEERARFLAGSSCGDEGCEIWTRPAFTRCVELLPTDSESIVIGDFHAG